MPRTPLAAALAERIEGLSVLDKPAKAIGRKIRSSVPAGPAKDALSGSWLGHALHPMLTDVPIGTWTSAVLLDLIGGRASEPAARRLIGTGLAVTPAVVATGWLDWADTEPGSDDVRRAGLLHAGVNGLATGLFAASLVARSGGRLGRGRALSAAGLAAVGAGGWLGGHLSYARGVGVDTTALEPDVTDWTPAIAEREVTEGVPVTAMVGGSGVLLVRQGGQIYALADRCAHRGGPLHEGELGDGTITCPWHDSCFRLEDGGVERGPSAYPQPRYDVRVVSGTVEVRRRTPRSFVAAA